MKITVLKNLTIKFHMVGKISNVQAPDVYKYVSKKRKLIKWFVADA